jgi:serine/threonine-protein kinase
MNAASLLPSAYVIAGEYEVVRPLDEGGMGRVYLVQQRSTGKQRALKVMHREIVADPSLQRRFEQEARVGARIPSEHVVEVLAAGVDAASGLPYLVMELLEGEDLRHRLDTRGGFAAHDVRAIFEQLCHAMAAAHGAGVVHRDLKPENVFLTVSRRAGAGRFTVKVLDFGIAKLAAEAGTRATRSAVGSPMWMAPEQTTPGPVTPAADVWAMGLLAYELLAGKPFWRAANDPGGTTAQLMREVVLDPIPAASTRAADQGLAARLPPGFDAWFERCVARDPGARFADAALAWRAMQRMFATRDALAETAVDPSGGPRGAETGEATPFVPAHRGPSVAPPAAVAPPATSLPQETPVAAVHPAARPPTPSRPGRGALLAGVTIAVLGIATGWVLSRPSRTTAVGAPMPMGSVSAAWSAMATAPGAATEIASASAPVLASAPALASAPVLASAPAPALASAPASAPAPALAPAPAPALASALASGSAPTPAPAPVLKPALAATTDSAPPAPRPAARPPLAGGFSDPPSPNGPTQWKVQDRHVRLLSRLVANESNVADSVVRKAVEWDAWQYLRCYERIFGGAKDLEEGTVTVGFEILDQLPRHAQLQGSTFQSKSFNDCVVGTLVGQTINAAGPDGKGHVVYAFRFVPN